MLITVPCLMPVVFLEEAGIASALILPALIFSVLLYFVAIYFAVYFFVGLFIRTPVAKSPARPNQSLQPTVGRPDE
jgi:hypothetical protein